MHSIMFSTRFIICSGILILIVISMGCGNRVELDQSQDKVEERRQQYIQQRQQEFDNG